MGKFVIECPDCGSYVELSTGLFAKKQVKCSCGRIISAKDNMLASKVCPHCGNTVMFDQSKGEKATCPLCHQKINTIADKIAFVDLKCPVCAAMQKVNKKADTHKCSVCGEVLDVKKLIAHNQLKESGDASIIKWDGSEDLLVYKHPIENFNIGSQLIVRVGQEALLFRDGIGLDLFNAGRYTLEKNVMPALNEIYKLSDDVNAYIQSEIYFINKIVLTGIRWGTPSKVRVMEQTYNFPIEIGARGSYNLEVCDARSFISRLTGNIKSAVTQTADGGVGYGTEYIRDKFADMIAQNITSMLAKIITENKINILTIDTMKPEIARLLGNVINNSLIEFGLRIPEGQFYLTDILTPDDDPNYIRMKNQYASSLDLRESDIALAQRKADARIDMFDVQTQVDMAKASTQGIADSVVIEAKGEAEKIKIEGKAVVDVYRDMAMTDAEALKAKGGDYEKETTRIVGSAIANSDLTFVNVNVQKNDSWTCPTCGKKDITSKFCPDCGSKKN